MFRLQFLWNGQHCCDHELEDMTEDMAAIMAAFANQIITPFVRSIGGWVNCVKFFLPKWIMKVRYGKVWYSWELG